MSFSASFSLFTSVCSVCIRSIRSLCMCGFLFCIWRLSLCLLLFAFLLSCMQHMDDEVEQYLVSVDFALRGLQVSTIELSAKVLELLLLYYCITVHKTYREALLSCFYSVLLRFIVGFLFYYVWCDLSVVLPSQLPPLIEYNRV